MRVLIVKTSSMGDVVHALPAISDMRANVPGVRVDWLVEAPFAAIPALHPGVQRVLPMAWRKWRRKLFSGQTWRDMGALRRELKRDPYDLVLDLQGLVKSAFWGVQARGPLVGYDRASISETLATLFYRRGAAVSPHLHAVERCRRLAAAHMGYAIPDTPPVFGLRAPDPNWQARAPYGVLIPNASRPEKLWPEDRWITIGKRFVAQGWRPVVLWGSEAERLAAERIAAACDGVVPPFLNVGDTAAVLSAAQTIVGLDTGFTHLGAAFGVSTLGIYCDHEPGSAGVTGPGRVASIGGIGQVPSLEAVAALLEQQLQADAR